MSFRGIRYIDIATCQVERAVTLYLDSADYISAITLAGAAEEILGKMAKKSKKDKRIRKSRIFDSGPSKTIRYK